MSDKKTEAILESILKIYPSLRLDNVIEDLEYELESLGINVKYADMSSLERNESKQNRRGNVSVGGYARVNRKGVPVIVLNGNNSYFKRRSSMAVLFAIIILEWKWLPYKGKADKKQMSIYFEGEDHLNGCALDLAANLLLPVKDVVDTVESLSFMKNEKVKVSMALDLLSKTYKVPDYIVQLQVGKYVNDMKNSQEV